jgi:RNA polymerase sigma-70 factor (ECF subfamily)
MMYGSTTDAISAAYTSHAAELHRFTAAKVRDAATAEDIVHEAFLRLAIESNAGRFPDHPRAWLYRVAWNVIVSRGRRATIAARHAARDRLEAVVAETPECRYLAMESRLQIESALMEASPRARRGLVMAAEGYSGREIALALGRKEPATRALIHRARKAVRRRLEDDDPEFGAAGRTRGSAQLDAA